MVLGLMDWPFFSIVCRVCQAGEDIFTGERRVLGEEIFGAIAGGEEAEDGCGGDAGAFDGGLAAADVGIDDDALHGLILGGRGWGDKAVDVGWVE